MAVLESELPGKSHPFLANGGKLFIDNEWVEAASGETLPTYDPATGKIVAHVAAGGAEDIDRAVKAARRAFDGGAWSRQTPSQRGQLLWKLAELLERDADTFARIESIDNGKPYSIARNGDVALAIDMFRYMGGWATKMLGTTIPLSVGFAHHSYTVREPIGVVGQIIPWNFPLLMAAWKIAPALAAGCSVVLKIAEQTPLTGLKLGELILEAGFPRGALNIISGYGETAGAALAAHDGVDKVAFTGSTDVGKMIVRAATGNLKKVTLELGGKSPAVVFSDADLVAAGQGAAAAIFYNQGQVCTAGSRLFVERASFDRVVADVSARAKAIRVGPGLDAATEMGPLVSAEQMSRVLGFVGSGISQGAEIVTGGGQIGSEGYFVQPTVITRTNPEMKIVREEIFGPVVVAEPFVEDDLDKIAAIANNSEFGLASSIWTKDISKAHLMAKRIKAGTVWINCHNVYDAALPFGGYKQSGWGREMGEFAMQNYTEVKAVTIKL